MIFGEGFWPLFLFSFLLSFLSQSRGRHPSTHGPLRYRTLRTRPNVEFNLRLSSISEVEEPTQTPQLFGRQTVQRESTAVAARDDLYMPIKISYTGAQTPCNSLNPQT